MRRFSILALLATVALVAGCVTVTDAPPPAAAPKSTVSRLSVSQATTRLAPIKARMEPVVERECRTAIPDMNCDFLIRIEPKENAPANAYQTLTESGRPVITFTAALVGDARNTDELAFILGHEAAHHMMLHIGRQERDASAGALVGGILAIALGAEASTVDAAMGLGADLGSRVYSKAYELEADRLGAILTHMSGYDPVRGVEYFNRIPDPGNRFLGTHPPNAQRIEIVRATAAGF